MDLSETGLNFIKQYERFIDHVYDDGYGNPTIGYGHKVQPGESWPEKITLEEGLALLALDTGIAQNAVNGSVKVPLTQGQYDALVSLVFNWGAGHWRKSSHLRYLNAGDYAATAKRISEFPITSKGVFSPGLARRRQEEARLFASNTQDAGSSVAPGSVDESTDEDISPESNFLVYLVGVGVLFVAAVLLTR